MANLQDTTIRGEEIVIDDGTTFNAIGAGVVLEDCTVRCRVPAGALDVQGRIVKSLVIVESDFAGFSWVDVELVECTFQGHLQENEFGTVGQSKGCCRSCVFRDADLDDCVFFGDDSDTHTFPAWPNFVMLDPHLHVAEMQAHSTDGPFADVVGAIDYLHEDGRAVAYNARVLAKRVGVGVDDVRRFFSRFSFVRM